MYVLGARVATFIAGGIALIISDKLGFKATYGFMACLMSIGVLATLLAKEPQHESSPKTLLEAVVKPLSEFFKREHALLLVAVILLYKFGDAFAGSLTNTFLLRGLDFSLSEVGAVKKTLEIVSTLLGVFLGGMWMKKISLQCALFYFGVLQAVSNLSFMILALIGHHFYAMVVAVFLENFCAGLGTAAFVALLTQLCNKQYTATQFALLSALAMVGRTLASPLAGILVAHLGWTIFYFGTFLISIPGLICLKWLESAVGDIASRPAYA